MAIFRPLEGGVAVVQRSASRIYKATDRFLTRTARLAAARSVESYAARPLVTIVVERRGPFHRRQRGCQAAIAAYPCGLRGLNSHEKDRAKGVGRACEIVNFKRKLQLFWTNSEQKIVRHTYL